MTEVREARSSDLGSLMELLRELHCETRNVAFCLNEEKMEDALQSFMEEENVQLLVAEVDGDVVGVHAGVVYADWFTDDLRADSFLVYVAKRAQGGLVGKRMVEMYEAWAFGCGAKKVTVGFASGGAVDRMGRLFERLGYARVGGIFEKETG